MIARSYSALESTLFAVAGYSVILLPTNREEGDKCYNVSSGT
jgi:hypothetical protein